jgi:hypothetical protein
MGDLGDEDTTFNEIQTLRIDADAGTFVLGYDGETTGPLQYNISAAALQTALEDLMIAAFAGDDNVDVDASNRDNIRVEKADDTYTIYFRGLLSNMQMEQISVEDFSALTKQVEQPGGGVDTLPGSAITATRLDGITSEAQNEEQTILLTTADPNNPETFVLEFWTFDQNGVAELLDGDTTGPLPTNISRADLQLKLEALASIVPGDVKLTEVTGGFLIEFKGELSTTDLPLIVLDTSGLVNDTATMSLNQDGTDTGLNDVQVLTIDATDGFYQLEIYVPAFQRTLTTSDIPFDADSEQVRRALQHALARLLNGLAADADLSRTREAFKSDFSVTKIENHYIIGFQGVARQLDGGEGVSLVGIDGDDDFDASGGAEIRTRMDGINYYGIEEVNLSLGSGTEIVNVQGTSRGSYKLELTPDQAAFNISLGDGNERIFISSDANLDHNTIGAIGNDVNADEFEFLTGHLDLISGNLNIDAGEGRHRLLISDEASDVGDDNILITDTLVTPAGGGAFDNTANSEIQIQGLAKGDITYGADTYTDATDTDVGDFHDGIIYWTGSGDDKIDIDGTHVRDDSVERTTTILNTGLGNDHITVDLDPLEDGFFVLHTQGGSTTESPVVALTESETDDDTVRAAESTLPLIIFGGLGNDDIIAGQADDVVFGDLGRVQYLNGSGELIAVFGFGARDDLIDSTVVDPTWVISRDLNLGGVDILEGQAGDDILIGGAGGNSIGDYIDGDSDDDFIFGDAVRLERRDIDVTETLPENITNPRYQELRGQMLYARNDLPDYLQGTDEGPLPDGLPDLLADDVGYVLVDGVSQPIRHQDGDPPATWNEYEIVELYHSFDIEAGLVPGLENSFGSDYIAGGSDHDIIFGQLGDDIIQGDGSIESAVGAESILTNRVAAAQAGINPVGAERVVDPSSPTMQLAPDTLEGAPDNSIVVDRMILEITPSFDATTDGDDYIEGNGGSDTIFGNLGQDDIVGGSSSLFTLETPDLRPDTGDTIFGGSGTAIGHDDTADVLGDVLIPEYDDHARDSDAIAGDNANIYRIVGAPAVTDATRITSASS